MTVRCKVCNGVLTSKRSIKLGMGQRCYRRVRGLDWPLRPRTSGTGPPIDDVDWEITGDGRNTIQLRLDAKW